MIEDFAARLAAVDRRVLTPLVQQALAKPNVAVSAWGYEFLHGGFGHWAGVYGVYRFRGTAQAGAETLAWSLILKALGSVSIGGSADPTAWFYWKREALVYQSGLLDELPGGLMAPHCFGVVEQSATEIWLWLEDIHEETSRIWPLAQYGVAAQHLGQFNGAYLVGRALPSQPWLTQGAGRDWLPLRDPYRSYFNDLHAWCQHPLAQRIMPEASIQGMDALWRQREPLLQALAQLPRGFCHHDAFRRNLLARRDQDGQPQTVAIDWACAGSGAVGEEAAPLLMGSLIFVELPMTQAIGLDATIFAGYLAGLQAAGWPGDPMLVRLGYTIAAVLLGIRMLCLDLHGINDNMPVDIVERSYGHPVDKILAQHAGLFRFTFDLADEARALIKASAH